MNTVTVFHNPTGSEWEQVEQYTTKLNIEEVAYLYEYVSENHGTVIFDNIIMLGNALKIKVE